MRWMGGLRKHMPITWITSLIGSLALIGFPFMSGFYSKDSIIEAVALSHTPGHAFAYFAVIAGVFVTAFYSFRMYFMVFHGKERYDQVPHDEHHDAHGGDHGHGHHKPHESPWVVTLPLILLAIPSVVIGFLTIGPMIYGDYFGASIFVDPQHEALAHMKEEFHSAVAMASHGFLQVPFILAISGVVLAWFFYLKRPDIPATLMKTFKPIYTLLDNKYYFDKFNEVVFAGGARLIGRGLWRGGDQIVIDGIVNGSARVVGWVASVVRLLQTGHIYQYAFSMIIGVFVLLTFWFNRV
jgi:NADH-quinone oxidoreductase subunit L